MRLYRLLLLVFPADFRRRFGDDMAEVFADRRRAARAIGRPALARLWMRTAVDLAAHGLAERRRRHSTPRSTLMLQSLVQDTRYALRTFRRRPGLTAVVLVTLALGIGANTAIFSVVHAVLLRELPYQDARRIVLVYETFRQNFNRGVANPFNFDRWQRESQSFDHLAAMQNRYATLTGAGDPERLPLRDVMPAFFHIFGVEPALGRTFGPTEATAGARVVVMSHELWTSKFGSDPDIVGREVVLDGEPWTVAGVMPAGFDFPNGAALWRPLELTAEDRAQMRSWYLGVVGKLKPGVTIAQAQAEMDAISARLEQEFPRQRAERGAWVVGLREDLVFRVDAGLRLLQGVALAVLLIACANLANLLLALASSRRRELGIRTSMGARRGRLVRQLLTESVLLSVAGGAAGTLLAVWGVEALVNMAPDRIRPTFTEIGVSGAALGFTLVVSTLCGLIFGVAPALLFSRPDPAAVLRDRTSDDAAGGRRGQRALRAGLITAQVALAFVLLYGSTLLVRSFVRLTSQDPGFVTERLLTADVTLPQAGYEEPDARRLFWNDLLAQLEALPDVSGVAASTALPFSNWEWQTDFQIQGREDVPNDGASIRTVTPGYFELMRLPVRQGRTFVPNDAPGGDRAVVVNDVFARRYLQGLDAVGLRLRTSRTTDMWATIIGVVGSSRHVRLDEEPPAEIYRVLDQAPPATFILALRTRGDAPNLPGALRSAVAQLDPRIPVQSIRTMDEAIGRTTAERRFHMMLLTLFAGLAGTLAAVGIYGVTTYTVRLRWRELGIRVALGARPAGVTGLVVRQGLWPVIAGLAIGALIVFQVSGVLQSELFGIEPIDGTTLGISAVGFAAVAMLSAYVPARRALRVDPIEVVRAE